MEERKVKKFVGGRMSQFWTICGSVVILVALTLGIVLARQTVVLFGSFTETKFNFWIALGIWVSGAVTSCGCFTLAHLLDNQMFILENQLTIMAALNIPDAVVEIAPLPIETEEKSE